LDEVGAVAEERYASDRLKNVEFGRHHFVEQ
jgi:hypothetical protein